MKELRKYEVKFKFNHSDDLGSVQIYASDREQAARFVRDYGVGCDGEYIAHAAPIAMSVTEIGRGEGKK